MTLDKTQDKTRQDMRHDKTRQDTTRQDKTQDKTRQEINENAADKHIPFQGHNVGGGGVGS